MLPCVCWVWKWAVGCQHVCYNCLNVFRGYFCPPVVKNHSPSEQVGVADILLCFQVFQVCVGTFSSMAVGLQVVGLILGVVSWCLQSSCTSSQVWKVRSQMESVSSSQQQFEGLWMSCAATSMGSIQCSRFKTVLGLPGESSLLTYQPQFVCNRWKSNQVIYKLMGGFNAVCFCVLPFKISLNRPEDPFKFFSYISIHELINQLSF